MVTFTLSLTNDGPSDANNIVVTDLVPSGFTWVSDSSAGSYDPNIGLWTIPNLASGSSSSIDIMVSINTTGSYINTAEVTAVDEIDPNSIPNNGDLNEDDMEQGTGIPEGYYRYRSN